MSILEAGIIGLGVGEAHIPGYNQVPHCVVGALCDRNTDRLERVSASHPGLRLYTSAHDLIDDPNVNVVSIASYDGDHFTQICRAISLGKHVFVEKPLCQSREELDIIRDLLARNTDVRLSTNLVLRSSPRFIDLRTQISEGAFGKIYYLEADYNYGRLPKLLDGWRGKQDFYSVVYGGGVHVVDLLMWLINERIVEVSAVGNAISSAGSGFKNMDMVVATLKFANGVVGKISVNFGSMRPHFHEVAVFGTSASFENRLEAGLLFKSRHPCSVPEKRVTPYPGTEKHALIPSFLGAILNKETAIVDEHAAFDCMSVCFAIEEAVQNSRIVNVEYPN